MHIAQPQLEHVRAGVDAFRTAVGHLVDDHRARTRELAARLAVPPNETDEATPDPDSDDNDDDNDDNDLVASWMADPRATPARRAGPHDTVLDRIDRGDLTWGDPEATAVREFLAQRVAEARRHRDGPA